MAQIRWVTVALLITTALIFQTAVVPALGLRTHTSVPVFLIILIAAQRMDLAAAVVVGGAAGLLIDLCPPSTGPLGMNALLGCLAAAAMCGWARATATDTAGIGATLAVLVVAVGLVAIVRFILTALFVSTPPAGVMVAGLMRDCVASALLAPVIAPTVDVLIRRPGLWDAAPRRGARR